MLLDEPFSALDAGLRGQMRKATGDILSAAGVTALLVTHDQSEAMSFADQVVVLRDGVLRRAGAPRDVYLAPVDRQTAEFLGEAIFLDAVITGDVAVCDLGHIRVDGGRPGPVTIMVRPEQIVLRPAGSTIVNGTAVLGRVLATRFAGATASVALEVARRPEGPRPRSTSRCPPASCRPTDPRCSSRSPAAPTHWPASQTNGSRSAISCASRPSRWPP